MVIIQEESSLGAVRTQNGPLLFLTGDDDLIYGPYKRNDGEIRNRKRAVLGPHGTKGTFQVKIII